MKKRSKSVYFMILFDLAMGFLAALVQHLTKLSPMVILIVAMLIVSAVSASLRRFFPGDLLILVCSGLLIAYAL